jgi:hypothetical protein
MTLGQHVIAAKITERMTINLALDTLNGLVLNEHQIPLNLSIAIPTRTTEDAAFIKNVTKRDDLHKNGESNAMELVRM